MKSLLLTVWAVLTLVSTPVAQPLPRAVHQALYDSQKAQEDGLSEEQVRHPLETYIDRAPNATHPMLFLALGNSWSRQQEEHKALAVYRRGVDIFPADSQLNYNRAVIAYTLEAFIEAAQAFETHASLVEDGAQSLYLAALAYTQNGSLGEGRRLLRSFVPKQSAARIEWLQLWAVVESGEGTLRPVQAALDRYLGIHPDDIRGWQLQLRLAMQQQHWSAAIAALEVMDALGSTQNQGLLSQLYQQAQLPLPAERRKVASTGDNPEWRLLAASGQLRKAARILAGQLETNPTIEGYGQLGQLYFRRGDWAAARTAFLQVGDGKIPPLYRLYAGYCALELRRFELAKEDFARLKESSRYGEFARAILHLLREME